MTTETESELQNVIAFPSKADDPVDKVNFLHEKAQWCLHPAAIVDEANRIIRCKKCQQVLDPFDYMLSIAKKETSLAGDIKSLREEERARRINIQKLIQIERNAKARIRNAGHKGSLPNWQLQDGKP